MHVVLCFFGINRSLRGTIDSIRRQIFAPLQRAGISYETHAAFMMPAAPLNNRRSGEFNVHLEEGTEQLLAPRVLVRVDQDLFDRTFDFGTVVAAPDPWQDGYASVRNVCRALKSLEVVTATWQDQFDAHADTVFCYLRPDLIYHDPLPVAQIRAQFSREHEDLFLTPGWATHGGINDRIACLGRRAARAYGKRLHQIDPFLRTHAGGLHAETLLRFVAQEFPSQKIQPPLLLRASRLRANGVLYPETFVNTSGKRLPPLWACASFLEARHRAWRARTDPWTRGLRRRWRKIHQNPRLARLRTFTRATTRQLCWLGNHASMGWGGRAVQPAAHVPVRCRPIAHDAWAGSSVNVVANARQALVTHADHQFAAYYDGRGRLVLAKRALQSDAWSTQSTPYAGNVDDAHNSASLAVDGAGILHVAWDHHGSPLHYATGEAPGSLTLGPRRPMTGQHEESVSYPQFHALPGGDLLFLYRDGRSGNGALVLNRFDHVARAWSRVQDRLIDGEDQRSPYWGACVDRHGSFHLSWIWRDTPDVASNHDLAYACSRDGGRTWTHSTGRPAVMPATLANADYIRRIPTGQNLMNSPMVAADQAGHPYVVTYWSDSAGTPPRFHVLWHDGQGWQDLGGPPQPMPFALTGLGTKRPPLSRAMVSVLETAAGKLVCLVYRDDRRGSRIVGAIRPVSSGPWREIELTTTGVGGWEPALDPAAWDRFGTLQMLVEEVEQRDGRDADAGLVWPRAISVLEWAPTGELGISSSAEAAS